MHHDRLDCKPLHRCIVAVEVEGFGRPDRSDRSRLRIRDALYQIVRGALLAAAVDESDYALSDRGDGLVGELSPRVSTGLLVALLVQGLLTELESHNAGVPERERMRLRAALHAGHEFSYALRLLGASVLREQLAATSTPLVLIVSEPVYEGGLRWRWEGIDPSRFERVSVTDAKGMGQPDAWIWTPDQQMALTSSPSAMSGCILNLPQRNTEFSGGDRLLATLQLALTRGRYRRTDQPGRQRAVLALHGVTGVGKSQLAREYAHRHHSEYDLVWWIRAESRATILAAFAEFAHRLGVPGQGDRRKLVNRLRVDVPSVAEATRFLLDRICGADRDAAARLARVLDRRPLALEQASACIRQTGMALDEYVRLYREQCGELLQEGKDTADGAPLQAVFQVAFNRVAEQAPTAAQLAKLCAFLAPSTIPHDRITARLDLLPPPLGEGIRHQPSYIATVNALRSFSLAEQEAWAERALRLVELAWPTDAPDPVTSPRYWHLLSHALVATSAADRLGIAPDTTARLRGRTRVSPAQRAEWRPAYQFGSQRLIESFPDGQLCVDLHGGSAAWRGPLEPLEALHQLLRALAVGDEELPTTVIRAAALYRRLTAGRRVLVVLDNADNAAQVRPLLPGNATCGVLLRGPLGLIALDNSSHLAADALDLGDAIALLRQIIGRARIAAEPEAAAAIVRMSDCRPLALRMHGSYLAARPRLRLGELAPQLRNEHRRQAALRLGDTGVRVAFTLAAEDVGPLAARVLCRLSLLPTPRFARQEVAAVAFDVFAVASAGAVEGGVIALVLDELARAGLLERLTGDRYRLDGLVRLLACERLAEEPVEQRCAALRNLHVWRRTRREMSLTRTP